MIDASIIKIQLDKEDKFQSFHFNKLACPKGEESESNISKFCSGRTLDEILSLTLTDLINNIKPKTEEGEFYVYTEWDALRSAIAKYIGNHDIPAIDHERCQVESIKYNDLGTEIGLVVLPPKDLPKERFTATELEGETA